MIDNLALETLINEANLLLLSAEEELQKPQKEMMSFSACQNAKLSILMFLKAYLVKHKIEFSEKDNLAELYNKCKLNSASFSSIKINEMGCVSDNHCSMEAYCMHYDLVVECVDKAKSVRKLLYRI